MVREFSIAQMQEYADLNRARAKALRKAGDRKGEREALKIEKEWLALIAQRLEVAA